MSKWDKLLLRVRSLSGDLRFDEIRRILESYGYEMRFPSGGSSHCTFRKEGHRSITIPKCDPVKHFYVELVREVVENEEKRK